MDRSRLMDFLCLALGAGVWCWVSEGRDGMMELIELMQSLVEAGSLKIVDEGLVKIDGFCLALVVGVGSPWRRFETMERYWWKSWLGRRWSAGDRTVCLGLGGRFLASRLKIGMWRVPVPEQM